MGHLTIVVILLVVEPLPPDPRVCARGVSLPSPPDSVLISFLFVGISFFLFDTAVVPQEIFGRLSFTFPVGYATL